MVVEHGVLEKLTLITIYFIENFKVKVICRSGENSSDLLKYTLDCKELIPYMNCNECLIQYKISKIAQYTEGFSNEDLEITESF